MRTRFETEAQGNILYARPRASAVLRIRNAIFWQSWKLRKFSFSDSECSTVTRDVPSSVTITVVSEKRGHQENYKCQ